MGERYGMSSRAIIGRFFQTLEDMKDAGFAQKIGMKFSSDQDSEEYKWLGAVPGMREWIGGRQPKGLRHDGVTIINKDFESTLEIDVKDIRRAKSDQIYRRIDDLALRAVMHWDNLVDDFIAAGTGSTLGNCYDGQYYFDSDHSEGDSGTQLNLLTATQVTQLNVGTAAAPTEAEMSLAILNTIAYMRGWKDDAGEPINGGARNFMVMVPSNLVGAAVAAVSSANLNTGSGMVGNTLLRMGDTIDVVQNSRRDAGTAVFYVFRTDGSMAPFILQEEVAPTMKAIAEGSELEFNSNIHRYGVEASRNVGFGAWQYAAHCTLS